MKKNTLLAAALFVASFGMAQVYTFSVSNATYGDLTGATSLNNGMIWDDPSFSIPIPFPFQYFGTTENTLLIENGLGAALEFSTTPGFFRIFGATDEDVIDRGYDSGVSESDISYKVEGTAPNRILKVQWKNVGFYGDYDDDGICQDFANFQVWLYETSMTIEYHYGQWSVTQPQVCLNYGTGPVIFLLDTYDSNTTAVTGLYDLRGNESNPTINSDGNQFYQASLDNLPMDGRVYRFSKNDLGMKELAEQKSVQVYPNPAKDQFTLDLQVESVMLIDVNGKAWNPAKVSGAYSLTGIPAGIYFVEAKSGEGVYREKLIVQ